MTRSHRSQFGAALVELALLMPFMLMPLVFGVTEFGRALYQYNTLVKATRDAARYLTMGAANDPAREPKAINLAVYGNTAGSGSPLVPGLSAAMITICDSADATSCAGDPPYAIGGGIGLVSVKVEGFQFQSVINFSAFGLTFGLGSITFGPIATTMRQV